MEHNRNHFVTAVTELNVFKQAKLIFESGISSLTLRVQIIEVAENELAFYTRRRRHTELLENQQLPSPSCLLCLPNVYSTSLEVHVYVQIFVRKL